MLLALSGRFGIRLSRSRGCSFGLRQLSVLLWLFLRLGIAVRRALGDRLGRKRRSLLGWQGWLCGLRRGLRCLVLVLKLSILAFLVKGNDLIFAFASCHGGQRRVGMALRGVRISTCNRMATADKIRLSGAALSFICRSLGKRSLWL